MKHSSGASFSFLLVSSVIIGAAQHRIGHRDGIGIPGFPRHFAGTKGDPHRGPVISTSAQKHVIAAKHANLQVVVFKEGSEFE